MPNPNPPKLKLYAPLPQYQKKQPNIKLVVAFIIVALLAAGVTRFLDSIHTTKAVAAAVTQQTENNQIESSDFSKLLNHITGKLNCQQFQTSFDIQKCQEHNNF